MERRFQRFTSLSALCVAAAVLLSACGGTSGTGTSETGNKEPIKIGLDIPISGTVAWMGSDYEQGATIAVNEINGAGGVLGHKLELIKSDGQCAPGPAVSAARYLIDVEKVDVIMGELCSSATLAVMQILPDAGVPNLTVTSTNPKISQQSGVGGNKWMFRLNIDDSIMAHTFAKTIAEKSKKVAIFAVNDDFGRGAVDAYKTEFAPLGVQVVDVEYYAHGEPDFRAMLSRTKEAGADAILLVMEANDAAVFVRQYHELGMTQTLYARGSVVTGEFLDQIKDNPSLGEGIMEATLWSYGLDNDINRKLNEAYQERWSRTTTVNGAMAYYGVRAIAKAIEASGDPTPKGIRDGLEKVDYEDGIGHVKFDDHHQAHPNMVINVIKDGKIQVLEVFPTE